MYRALSYIIYVLIFGFSLQILTLTFFYFRKVPDTLRHTMKYMLKGLWGLNAIFSTDTVDGVFFEVNSLRFFP